MRHTIGIVVVPPVLAWTVLVSACSTTSHQSNPTSSTHVAPTPAQRITRVEVPVSAGNLIGARNLSDCDGQLSRDPQPHKTLFDTKAGRFVSLPNPSVHAPEEFIVGACVVTENPAGEVRVIHAVTTKTPSHGLTPESTETDLSVFNAQSSTPLITKRLPDLLQGDLSVLSPSAGGFYIANAVETGDRLSSVRYFNADTLAVTANFQDTDNHAISGATLDGYAVTDRSHEPPTVEFFSTDGSNVGEFANVKNVTPTNSGFLVDHDGQDQAQGVFYFDIKSKDITANIAPYMPDRTVASFGPGLSGDMHFYSAFNGRYYGDRILLEGDRAKRYIIVYDLAAKKEISRLSDEQLARLSVDINKTFIGGDYLYIAKDPDNPVLDTRTNQIAASGWKLAPLAPLADDWVLFRRTTPNSDGSGAFLARGETGRYNGPWF
jgi:hypothetical protein